MKRETCRFLLGIIIVLMCLIPIVSIGLSLIVNVKFILLIFVDAILIVSGVALVEYADNRYGGNW